MCAIMSQVIFLTGALMKRTIFTGASLFLTASVLAMACGSKDPPAQQPQPPGFYGQPGQPGQYPPGQDPNAQYNPQQQPGAYPQQPGAYPQQPGAYPQQPGAYPQQPNTGMPPGAPAPAPTVASAPAPQSGAADAATAAAVRLALQPRAATEAKGMKEDGAAIGGMLQEGGQLTQEFMLMPGKCYTVLGQGLPPIAELDLNLSAKPLLPALPPAVLAADSTTGPSASIGAGKNCYKNPFPLAAAVILTLKATKGSGPVGAQVYSK
jgi:hypothetical protein